MTLTSCKSLPSSSLINLSNRSSSASIPTDERTFLTSLAEGDVLPPSPRRRYAARCFIFLVLRLLSAICTLNEAIERLCQPYFGKKLGRERESQSI